MKAFVQIEGIAAPLAQSNVDTDKILPARFLKTISREGLKAGLFASLRENPDFVLNREPWSKAEILIVLDNFGCGSSCEHAPWALADYGIRCVIACGFADIFYNNCFKNGILPVVLARNDVDDLLALVSSPSAASLKIDLGSQTIESSNGRIYTFSIEAKRKRDLILGADEIAASMRLEDEISAFEADSARRMPWWRGLRREEKMLETLQ